MRWMINGLDSSDIVQHRHVSDDRRMNNYFRITDSGDVD